MNNDFAESWKLFLGGGNFNPIEAARFRELAATAASSTPTAELPESLGPPAPNILATHRGGLISNTVLGASDGATSLLLSSMRRSIAVFLDPNPAITARRLDASEE